MTLEKILNNNEYVKAIRYLQVQENMPIHVGGITALILEGRNHYLELNPNRIIFFGVNQKKLPKWFLKHDWGIRNDYYQSKFLSTKMGLKWFNHEGTNIRISNSVRAMMEFLYMTPHIEELTEGYQIMENLFDIEAVAVQPLLENCSSVKVNRLFLYMAEKVNYKWFKGIDQSKINLGSGPRSLAKNGVYVPKYKITVTQDLYHYV